MRSSSAAHRFALLLVTAAMTSSVGADETPAATAGEPPADELYKVVDGTKVDANTLNGWKTWRALACERCHGAEQ